MTNGDNKRSKVILLIRIRAVNLLLLFLFVLCSSSKETIAFFQYRKVLRRISFLGYQNNNVIYHVGRKVMNGITITTTTQQQQQKSNNHEFSHPQQQRQCKFARLIGYVSDENRPLFEAALIGEGFSLLPDSDHDDDNNDNNSSVSQYQFNSASGMLQLVSVTNDDDNNANRNHKMHQLQGHESHDSSTRRSMELSPPRWIPIVQEKETVLVSNGWSFLDMDEQEPISPFDNDAANKEGTYQPKWGQQQEQENSDRMKVSQLGFSIQRMTTNEIQHQAAMLTNDISRAVLLQGATDPYGRKQTNNGYDLSKNMQRAITEDGIFVCAIGGLPLYTSADISYPGTVSSGWLSFVRPISMDHITLIEPATSVSDERIEVICSKSGCHLGHYFGIGEGYCINASALNFIPIQRSTTTIEGNMNRQQHAISEEDRMMSHVVSYRELEQHFIKNNDSPSMRILRNYIYTYIRTETILLGAGCFWSIENAVRQLPGIVDTIVGYAGGHEQRNKNNNNSNLPVTYEQVCQGMAGHAEVVSVTYDPMIINLSILLDCFFAFHDPTIVRAHGKQSMENGQYRSCIYVLDNQLPEKMQQQYDIAIESCQKCQKCQKQLGKDLSTEIRILSSSDETRTTTTGMLLFHPAEDWHQRFYEIKRNKGIRVFDDDDECRMTTLSFVEWLSIYGKRRTSVLGSGQTLEDEEEMIEMNRLMI